MREKVNEKKAKNLYPKILSEVKKSEKNTTEK